MPERTFFLPLGIKKETTKGVAVIPDVHVPVYQESLSTDIGAISDEPAFGRRLKRLQTLQGNRSHKGALKLMAEPNTLARLADMVLPVLSTSGAGPYTRQYGESASVDPNSYTIDIPKGQYVVRFIGVEASKMSLGFNNGKMEADLDVSGLASFYPREIASTSGTGPYTVTLKTDYDATPTRGLVTGDAIKFYDVSANTYITATVASVPSGTTFTTVTNPSLIAAGDMVMLAPATPALSLLTPFLQGKTQFYFAADAATAFSNSSTIANQTQLESGTSFAIMNPFSKDTGEARFGSFDPASLVRADGIDVEFNPEVYLDTPDKVREWAALAKRAVVIRSFVGSTNQYELRITLNDCRVVANDTAGQAGKVLYHKYKFQPNMDFTDAQMFDMKIINAVATI